MKKIIKQIRSSIFIIPIFVGLLTVALQDWCKERMGLSIYATVWFFFICSFIFYILWHIFKIRKDNYKQLGIKEIEEIISQKRYFDKPLFFISGREYNQFGVAMQNRKYRISLLFRKIFFFYPVIYYNVTAKNFLNWIDYIYLDTLRELHEQINAKIIISLHIDEQLMNESLFREDKRSVYQSKKKEAEEIIHKILPEAIVVDEFEFYINAKKSTEVFPEQLISIIVSHINFYVNELVGKTIDFKQFIRYESNVLSILPILTLAKKYKHLFVLDYESSFDVWKLPPYPDLKKDRKIFFIKCNKIKGKNGERIPAWSENDGINFTDSEIIVEEKVEKLDEELVSVMIEFFVKDSCDKTIQRAQLKNELLKIKHKFNL